MASVTKAAMGENTNKLTQVELFSVQVKHLIFVSIKCIMKMLKRIKYHDSLCPEHYSNWEILLK
jgi:hypothetical protein